MVTLIASLKVSGEATAAGFGLLGTVAGYIFGKDQNADAPRPEGNFGVKYGHYPAAPPIDDAVAVNLRAVDHHIAEVDSDPKFHSVVGRQTGVFAFERGLDFYRAGLDGVYDAGELG